ncbi:hypothetical protein AMTRI_Chr07g81950 [Amborella trichopoda]
MGNPAKSSSPKANRSIDIGEDESVVLSWLLDAFPMVPHKEIASAYCKAKGDGHKAAEILSELQNNNHGTVISDAAEILSGLQNNNHGTVISDAKSQESMPMSVIEKKNETHFKNYSKSQKPKKVSVSMGTVSSVLLKGYTRPVGSNHREPQRANNQNVNYSLKWKGKEVMKEEDVEKCPPLFSEEVKSPTNTNKWDLEEFFISMLGDGYHLDENEIRKVLRHCGYDAIKSVDSLLSLSPRSINKDTDSLCSKFGKFIVQLMNDETTMELPLPDDQHHVAEVSRREDAGFVAKKGTGSPDSEAQRHVLQREVLEALFNVPERPEQEPKLLMRTKEMKQRMVIIQEAEATPTADVEPQQVLETAKEDEVDEYEVLRRTVRQHWETMKTYYHAAAEAYSNGNISHAKYLSEQGKFYSNKARESDEKCTRKMFEVKNQDIKNEVTLDLRDQHAKQALRLLKFHLSTLSSIPSIQFLKVITENNSENMTKGSRKRLVTKLLDKESIKWRQGEDATIMVHIEDVDPKKLSFAKPGSDDD